MPTAREALLDAAFTAVAGRPWSRVRMVDVAAAARVSRQTLYNEFGSKDGLARALVRREADTYLAGVERALVERVPVDRMPADRAEMVQDRLLAVAEWTVAAARANPLVRALLTGCWSERLPAPSPARTHLGGVSMSPVPAQRRADAGHPGPAELAAAVRDRAVAVLERGYAKEEAGAVANRCELAVRLALSYVVAPGGSAGNGESGEDFRRLLRAVLGNGLTGTSRRAGDR
ncbi:TetR/AcrR family transcriptional regulator [Streptomyces spiramyceticus]|uniref:TetR/AcrR family transcriptional regulator n=1 Tax=Streptomyces spiramyceticus TaxID=299717 RepID=UPI00237C37F2|nr:TetR/AcrR family transcriptional regulator [Streptomyces spiramyceticus]